MLKSCHYCGRVHDGRYICPEKQRRLKERQAKRTERNRKVYEFHRSEAWTSKSLDIRERDRFCCQVCARGLYEPERQCETDEISVHHIIPVAEDWERRLDDDILVTLCRRHHEMAEKGQIKRGELLRVAREQEEKNEYPVCG